jgi:hypothetical protein
MAMSCAAACSSSGNDLQASDGSAAAPPDGPIKALADGTADEPAIGVPSGPDATGDATVGSDAGDASFDGKSAIVADAADVSSLPQLISCNETTTCQTATPLPSILGDFPGSASSVASTSGDHSEWVVIGVTPYLGAGTANSEAVRIWLIQPRRGHFAFDVYLGGMGANVPNCSQIAGSMDQDQILRFTWSKGYGQLVSVHVYASTAPSDAAVAADADATAAADAASAEDGGLACTAGDDWTLDFSGD